MRKKDAIAWSWAHNSTQVNGARIALRANVICNQRKRPIELRADCP
ncbi:hypothetical protein [Bradyrhizobium oropedii]|nr:hypothetical protein [Bradyrhizobium oropedii]